MRTRPGRTRYSATESPAEASPTRVTSAPRRASPSAATTAYCPTAPKSGGSQSHR